MSLFERIYTSVFQFMADNYPTEEHLLYFNQTKATPSKSFIL